MRVCTCMRALACACLWPRKDRALLEVLRRAELVARRLVLDFVCFLKAQQREGDQISLFCFLKNKNNAYLGRSIDSSAARRGVFEQLIYQF